MNQVQTKADTGVKNRVVDVPTLYVGATEDYPCPPASIKLPSDAGFLPHLTNVTIDSGHWIPLAKPEEFGNAVVNWLNGIFC